MPINNINAISLIPTSINIPEVFGVDTMDTADSTLTLDTNFKIVQDINGLNSIIELDVIPYIDFTKFDYDRRKFFSIDKYDNLWRKYVVNDYIFEEDTIHEISSGYSTTRFYSMYNILTSIPYLNVGHPGHSAHLNIVKDFDIKQYEPITIYANGEKLTDVTDYSFNVNPTLNFVNSDFNKQFYIKGNKIYSNIDFLRYNTADIDISYKHTVDGLNVSCVMGANSSANSNYTPVVDYFMLKLTGQNL